MMRQILLGLLWLSMGFNRVAAEGIYPNTWVHPSATGNLLYRHDEKGVRVPDFSECGYKGGIQELPDANLVVPEPDRWIYLNPVVGAAGHAIMLQNAFATLGAKTVNSNGFRGVVYLNAGEYLIDRTIMITNSGIILKGSGSSGPSRATLRATGKVQYNMLSITGRVERADSFNPLITLINPVVPAGSRTFKVFDPLDLKVGDTILITRPFTPEWIHEIDMDQLEVYSCPPGATSIDQCTLIKGKNWDSGRSLIFERKITAIDGLWITVDSEVTQTFDLQYGGGFAQKTSWPERLNTIGVEDIEVISSYGSDDDENHGWVAIEIHNTEDLWIRNVIGKHFGMSLVNLSYGSRRTTVTDCQLFDPISKLEGNRRYPFQMHKGDHHLVKDCYADDGRHDFAFGSLVPGPNANVRSQSHESHADSGPHLGWAVGGLYDLISLDASWGAGFLDKVGINVQNRGRNTQNHGWAGAYMTVWNCNAPNFRVRNPPTARNWLIGSIGYIYDSQFWLPPVGDDPEGTYELSGPFVPNLQTAHPTIGRHVDPYSLYFAQLQQRLKWPGSEFREYRLGDIDNFGEVPSPEDQAPVDAPFFSAIQQNAGNLTVAKNFDAHSGNRQLAFTFYVPLKGAERVVAASLVLSMKAIGHGASSDALYLDNPSVGTPLGAGGLDWKLHEDSPTIETLEIDPQLLSDGQLNVSINRNVSVDWATLHVQVSTVAYTELAYPPLADTYVRGGSHKSETHGSETALWVKNEDDGDFSRRTYLNWPLPSTPKTLVGAKVRLYCNGTGDPKNVFSVSRARHDDWDEGGLNWLNQPGSFQPFAYFVPKQEGFVEFSVFPQALDAMVHHRRLPLQIWAPYDLGDAGFTSFASKEDPDPTHAPRLILQFKDEPPTLQPLTNITFAANSTFGPIPLVINDAETALNALIVTATSSNPALLPANNLILGGTGANRTLILKPLPNQTGFAEITVTLNDGLQSVSRSFIAHVGTPFAPPTLSSIPDQLLFEHTPSAKIPITLTDPSGRAAALQLNVGASLVSRRPQLSVLFGREEEASPVDPKVSHRFMTITPIETYTGTSRINVELTDGFTTTSQLVSVTVQPVDDPPGPIQIVAPPLGTTFTTNQPIVLEALVTDLERDLAKVEFYNGTNLLGTVTQKPFLLKWKNPPAGAQSIRGTAIDLAGHRTMSEEVLFQIGPDPEAPPLLKIAPSDGNLQIGWDVEAGIYRLQSTDSLKAPIVWTDVSRLVGSSTGGVSVVIAPAIVGRFYRLSEAP